jgi:hypothetical protein
VIRDTSRLKGWGRKIYKCGWKAVVRGQDDVGCKAKIRECEVDEERSGSKKGPKIPKSG